MAQAGKYRHRVTVRLAHEVADGHGGFTTSPVALSVRVPALVVPLAGRELERAAQIDPRIRYRVELRAVRGLTARQTLIFHAREGDRTLEIIAPPLDHEARGVELHLLCSEAA